MNLDQEAQQSYQQGQQLYNQLGSQAQNATNTYNTAYGAANNAQGQLSDFTKNMQQGSDIYAKALQASNANAGYDVNNLNQAQNQVSQVTGILGGLPRAVQASNANYGATAGDVAGQYATEGANLNQTLQLANQNAANQLAKQQAGLTGAQQGTTAQVTTQQNQLQGYQQAAQNAVAIADQARQTMTSLESLYQQQGNLNAQQQQTYAQAKANLAAASQAYAQAGLLAAQTTQQGLQNQQTQAYMGSNAYQNYLKYGNAAGPTPTSAPVPNAGSNSGGGGFNLFNTTGNLLGSLGTFSQQAGQNTSRFFGDVAHNLGVV